MHNLAPRIAWSFPTLLISCSYLTYGMYSTVRGNTPPVVFPLHCIPMLSFESPAASCLRGGAVSVPLPPTLPSLFSEGIDTSPCIVP